MSNTLRTNPYVISGPVVGRRLFLGRTAVFDWVRSHLEAFPLRQQMVLRGAPCMGKSSVLHQLATHRMPGKVVPIYVDMALLGVESVTLFFQGLAQVVRAAAAQHEVAIPEPDAANFVQDPRAAFDAAILQPMLQVLNGRKAFFLLDHAQRLMARMSDTNLPPDTLAALHDLLQKYPQVYSLYALDTPAADAADDPAFLADVPTFELGPLDQDAAMALICDPMPQILVKDVARYIFSLVGGHPQRIQLLCHRLVARQQQQGLRHLTVADVAAEHRALLAKGAWPGGSATLSSAYQLGLAAAPARQAQSARGDRSAGRWLWLLLLLPLLLLGGLWLRDRRPVEMALAPIPSPTRPVAAAVPTEGATAVVAAVAALPTETLAPTETPAPTETAVPTETPPPTETAVPTQRPSPTSTPRPATLPDQYVRSVDDMPMRLIPGGVFTMGSPDGDVRAGADEMPEHLVALDAFYMDQFEVSVAQYAAFVTHMGGYEDTCSGIACVLPRERIGYTSYLIEEDLGDATLFTALTGYARYPINHVSWYGAAAYCAYVGGRLPTEAEWEYAARGDDRRLYPWGNEPPDETRAVFQSQSYDDMKPVDALPAGASPFGVFGMAGSLWEWTADWYDENYYSRSPEENPTGPETGISKAVRGGAWPNNNEADRIRSTNRFPLEPDFISATVGFRCVVDP
ncbi:MAG: formylglycine-generating enzyme family protein [Anaerolineales bacterium]|nr:formylglycine-generating enzyme family protein [Anaerolineales bacterium]